jgi:hypothetical protein
VEGVYVLLKVVSIRELSSAVGEETPVDFLIHLVPDHHQFLALLYSLGLAATMAHVNSPGGEYMGEASLGSSKVSLK